MVTWNNVLLFMAFSKCHSPQSQVINQKLNKSWALSHTHTYTYIYIYIYIYSVLGAYTES